jgi:hypothetical protein
MATLIEFIRFEGKRFAEVTDEGEMKMMLQMDEKLQSLESEILQHPKGVINIRKSGVVFITHFPDELLKKISAL